MTITLHWPQIVYIILELISIASEIYKREGIKYFSAFITGRATMWGILYSGGFFG